MTAGERIEQLEGEVRAAIFAGAECIAHLVRELAKGDEQSLRMMAMALRNDAGRATSSGRLVRADMLEMAAEMLED